MDVRKLVQEIFKVLMKCQRISMGDGHFGLENFLGIVQKGCRKREREIENGIG